MPGMRPERISGFAGLVIQPDAATIRTAYTLAASVMPAGAEHALGPGSLPHVTLAQCALREAPGERCAELVASLDAELRGRSIPLSAVVPFGGGFAFWCVDEASPARRILQTAHERALALGEGLLDPVANAAVVAQTIRLTGGDPVLVANARAHGYAFVGDRYAPHITLGFEPELTLETRMHPHVMTVERVVLVALGRHGRVARVYALQAGPG